MSIAENELQGILTHRRGAGQLDRAGILRCCTQWCRPARGATAGSTQCGGADHGARALRPAQHQGIRTKRNTFRWCRSQVWRRSEAHIAAGLGMRWSARRAALRTSGSGSCAASWASSDRAAVDFSQPNTPTASRRTDARHAVVPRARGLRRQAGAALSECVARRRPRMRRRFVHEESR